MPARNCKKRSSAFRDHEIPPSMELKENVKKTTEPRDDVEDTNYTCQSQLSEKVNNDTSSAEDNSCDLKRILSESEYTAICNFVKGYNGLSIDCELDLLIKYPHIHPLTMQSIVEEAAISNFTNINENSAHRISDYLKRFDEMCANNICTDALLKIAREEKVQPMLLCRVLCKSIFKTRSKSYLTYLLRYPHMLEDCQFRANVTCCSVSDNNFGPYIDLKRQILGSEYEAKLQKMAKEAGMHFHNEVKLRALGYDKTPDMKMILPFLYKSKIINWMESKARFGSISVHRQCVKEQYSSYCNRFGAGIVIYWFGYHEKILEMKDVNIDVTVLCDFPDTADITNFAVH